MTRACPGPDAPGKPRLKAPPGTVDTHMHVFGPYDKFPLAEGRGYTCPPATVAAYDKLKASVGIDACVIVHGSANGRSLDCTTDALKQWGDKARGVAVLPPDVTDAELRRLHDVGYRATRLTNALKGGVPLDHLETMAAKVKPLGWHIQVYTAGADEMAAIAPRLAKLPVDVVIDHMGNVRAPHGADHPGFRALLDLVRGGRCWVKLSAAYRLTPKPAPWSDVTPLAKALIALRPDRMLWASDWPHVMAWDFPMPDDAAILDWALEWGVGEKGIRQILVDNPRRLFWSN